MENTVASLISTRCTDTTEISFTNKTYHQDITEILVKVALNLYYPLVI